MNDNNLWKHVDPGDVSKNPYYKKSETTNNTKPPETKKSAILGNSIYNLMRQTNTYAKGVDALKTQLQNTPSSLHPQFTLPNGSNIYRPLTFKENIEARITEYNREKNIDGSKRTDAQKLELFNTWIDSCTGIAYKKKTKLFKINPVCNELINIPEDFNSNFLSTDYSKFSGIELYSSTGTYNQNLSLNQVLTHPAWITALENDKTLLKEYAEITFYILKTKNNQDSGMGFFVRSGTSTDELRVLYSDSLSNITSSDLNSLARFLLVAPFAKKI